MIGNSAFLIISNLIYVCIVVWSIYSMLRAASVINWNPGKIDLQKAERIKILTSMVIVVSVGIVAAITNILFG